MGSDPSKTRFLNLMTQKSKGLKFLGQHLGLLPSSDNVF